MSHQLTQLAVSENMVTSTSGTRSEELQELLTNKSSQRWDLIDPKKRDAWLLRTLSKLESEDALEAVKAGPPTPATV